MTLATSCSKRDSHRQTLLVFAAASTADALQEIGRRFQRESGIPVQFSFGASNDLACQIRADPEGVPAGVYAKQWLQAQGVWEAVALKVVPTLDVRAALSAVETESANAGIVYRTDAMYSHKVRIALEIPATKVLALPTQWPN